MSVTELIQKQIGDLLPNEQILNFHEGVSKLPEWLGDNLKIILCAGDGDQRGYSNVLLPFHMFDVFFCYPAYNSIRQNVLDLLQYFPKKKVICLIDITNKSQMEQFLSLFKNRFSLIDGYYGHCPYFNIDQISKVLKVGGTALNINYLDPEIRRVNRSVDKLQTILSKSTHGLTPDDALILSGRYDIFPKEKLINLSYRLIFHIENKLQTIKNYSVDWSILTKDDDIENFKILIDILISLIFVDPLFGDPIPPTLRGVFKNYKRIWDGNRIYKELVLTKVQEGGSRRKRKMTRKRAASKAKAKH